MTGVWRAVQRRIGWAIGGVLIAVVIRLVGGALT